MRPINETYEENRPLSRSEIHEIFTKVRIEMGLIFDKIRDEKYTSNVSVPRSSRGGNMCCSIHLSYGNLF